MQDALAGPANLFHLIKKQETRDRLGSTEIYIKYVMESLSVPVLREFNASRLPITEGTCVDGSFCTVKRTIDCRPRGLVTPNWPECPKLQITVSLDNTNFLQRVYGSELSHAR